MFFDIGIGVFLSVIISSLLNLPLTSSYLLAGIAFSLLVDLDYIFQLFLGGSSKNAYKHRFYLHYPLPYILVGTGVFSFFGLKLALLFALCSLFHFIHDSVGIGWGIQWFYPFTQNHYSFLYLYQPKGKTSLPKKLVYSWKHEDIKKLADQYGDPNWLHNIYLKAHPYSIIEFLVFISSLIFLYFYIK